MPDLSISLNLVFWIVLLAGLAVMVMAFVVDGLLHFGDDGSVTPTLALFLTLFGATGIIVLATTGSETAALAGSITLSTGGAAAGYFFFFRKLSTNDLTLRDRREDIVGKTAEVSLSIQPDAPGQITFVTDSGRSTATARSADGTTIKQGMLVEVVQCVGTTYLVRPLNPSTQDIQPKKEQTA